MTVAQTKAARRRIKNDNVSRKVANRRTSAENSTKRVKGSEVAREQRR